MYKLCRLCRVVVVGMFWYNEATKKTSYIIRCSWIRIL